VINDFILKIQRLKKIMAQDANPNLALRITVESGGCHGFQYLMSLTTLPPISNSSPKSTFPNLSGPTTSSSDASSVPPLSRPPSSTDPSSNVEISLDDTVFQVLDGSGAKVVMDGPSLELLKGSKIDYTMELIGSQFKIVDNPLATSNCGCGTSFDVKA
jgi:Fe-S cluster assembly iron-binding protein IscA